MEAKHRPVSELLEAITRQPKIKRSEYQDQGRFPIVDQSQADIAGYTDDPSWLYQGQLPVVIFGDHTRVLKFIDHPFCVGADGTQLLRPIAGNDIRYFYYALRNLDLTNYGYERHFKYLKEEEIPVPSLPIQQRIASILSAYDDLIENNTRRIAILEEMARRLYEEWFVHFHFPGYERVKMIESEIGRVPEGWPVQTVNSIVKRLPTGTTYKENDVSESGDVVVVDQSRSEQLGFHDNAPDHLATADAPVVIFGDHTCKMQIMISPFSLGPNTVPFISADETSVYYVYALVAGLVTTTEYKRHWTELSNRRIAKSPSALSLLYEHTVKPQFVLMETSCKKNRNLRTQRDLLLPKLISGEIDVANMGEPLAEAAE